MDRVEREIDDFVRGIMGNSEIGAHSYEHTLRVLFLAREIGRETGANLRILAAASLLHDIGRLREEETGVSHSILSGEMSRTVLSRIGYSEDEIRRVGEAIRTHRYSERLVPTSLEGQILSDADKLDAIGAVGVYRAITQAAANGTGMGGFLAHANEKLLKLQDMMYTEKARQLAKPRHRLLREYVDTLGSELAHQSQ